MPLTVEVTNLEDISAVIETVMAGIASASESPGYANALPILVEQSRIAHAGYFATSTDPAGTAWAPLAPSTIERKGHDTILVDTGKLRASLTASSAGGDAIRETFDNGNQAGITFGTSVEYAGYHMSGASRMPARPEVGVNDKLADEMANTIADHVVRQILKDIPA